MRRIQVVTIAFILVMTCCWCTSKVDSREETVPVSKVRSFNYLGFGDKICATLYGKVYEQQATKVPLLQVQIRIDKYPQVIKTNAAGEFEVCLTDGEYNIEISKAGYQMIQLLNHKAVSDQVSETEIILGKGTGKVDFTIPDPEPEE